MGHHEKWDITKNGTSRKMGHHEKWDITKNSCNVIELISVAQSQMALRKAWLHTSRGCNHQSFARPNYSFDFRLFWGLVLEFTILKLGMKVQVILETTIEPHDLVCYFCEGHSSNVFNPAPRILTSCFNFPNPSIILVAMEWPIFNCLFSKLIYFFNYHVHAYCFT